MGDKREMKSMFGQLSASWRVAALACTLGASAVCAVPGGAAGAAPTAEKTHSSRKHATDDASQSVAKIWEARSQLTPTQVYWGPGSRFSDPLSRLPAPPYSHVEKDTTENATSPKVKLKDSQGTKWTVKFGEEARADTVTPRLAWALGFGAVEGYYVDSGKLQGVDQTTDLGIAKGSVKPDGSFSGGARFKMHDKDYEPLKDAKGNDLTWDEGKNPGVPPEQLSGLLIFDVLVHNWDAQPKNCKVYRMKGPNGRQTWYIESDLGASFADVPRHKYILADYEKEASYIKSVSADTVELSFSDFVRSQARLHQRIPLAHAQWFRGQLAKLTDAKIQAAFDAAYATDALNRAYASGDEAKIKAAREHEISAANRKEIAGFVTTLRARINEFMQKVPDSGHVAEATSPASR